MRSELIAVLLNSSAVLAVIISGILGFYLSYLYRPSVPHDRPNHEDVEISTLGQIFGWGCAFLYLGSRIPQVVKNLRRKSTEGLSLLFFLFACLGNITYVLSILSASLDPRYILANLSWLAGSAGTLLLDGMVSSIENELMLLFIQFFMYREIEESDDEEADTETETESSVAQEDTGGYGTRSRI
jgi:solute carrier family 66 (lysosomal lysine-arginine transporter), member 1